MRKDLILLDVLERQEAEVSDIYLGYHAEMNH